eukprot:scaffold199208_cov33-Tisochrysis_lutea.AAC.3
MEGRDACSRRPTGSARVTLTVPARASFQLPPPRPSCLRGGQAICAAPKRGAYPPSAAQLKSPALGPGRTSQTLVHQQSAVLTPAYCPKGYPGVAARPRGGYQWTR